MARTVYYTATTLDGFLATEDDSLDWLFACRHDDKGALGYEAFFAGVGAMVMGSTTYEWLLDHEAGKPWPYAVPCWVLTRRTLPAAGESVRFAQGDVGPVHAAMVEAANGKDVWVVGGGDVAGQLADLGLLDELLVMVAPVTLGAGKPLLPRRVELETWEVARNGDFACVTYRVGRPSSR
jgi:dihydrofolate reductase